MTSRWNVAKTSRVTSPRHLIGTSSRRLKRTQQRSLVSASSRRLKQVSNETPNDFSLVLHQDASVVRIHDVPLVRPYDVCCKSQMKQPLTSLCYVFTMSQSYVVAPPCYKVSTRFSSYFVMTSIW